MSSICTNCQARLSCGCQKRVASNGTAVCSTCLASYEAKLTGGKHAGTPVAPKSTDPSNVTVMYQRK